MGAARTITVLVTGNASSLRTVLVAAGRDVRTFDAEVASMSGSVSGAGSAASSSSGKILTMGRAMMVAKVGALVLAAALVYSAAVAAKFDAKMRNVNSIAQMSETQLAKTSRQVVDLSTKLPQSADSLAQGLYMIVSAGFKGADSMTILHEAALGASAGLTDTETATKGILAVLDAYGLSASSAAHVTNVLFTAVHSGLTTFGALSNVIGNFIGTASMLHVPIEDAAAALSTITLSGVNVNQAATSLNRLMQSLVKTSAPLGKVFASWGFESGEAAVHALGLRGVMERLRITTHGNITELQQLFPEIRAVRGAVALMANDGKTYARVSRESTEADKGQGAAKAALAQQLKSTSAQWKLFVNWVNATAITVGAKLLPVVNSLITYLRGVFTTIGHFLADAGSKLAPFFHDMAAGLKMWWENQKKIVNDLGPLIHLLGMIVGGAIVGGLKLVGKTFVLAETGVHKFSGAIAFAVGTLLIFKGVAMAGAGLQFLASLWETVALKAMYAADTFTAAAAAEAAAGGGIFAQGIAGFSALAGGITAAGVATGVFAVAVVGAAFVVKAIDNENKKAAQSASKFVNSLKIDPNTVSDWENAGKRIHAQIKKVGQDAHANSALGDLMNLGQLINPWQSNGIQKARSETKAYAAAQQEASFRSSALKYNIDALSKELGVSKTAVVSLARANKIDLSQGFGISDRATHKMIKTLYALGRRYGETTQQTKLYATLSKKDLEAAMKAEQKFLDGVQKAAEKTQDPFEKFGKEGAGPSRLKDFYTNQLKIVTDFTGNIQKAIAMGLDPSVIKDALTRGPAEAGGLLESIVSDATGNMVKLVNAGAGALEAANLKLIEMARIAYRASTAQSQQMVKDSILASKIGMETLNSNATLTAESLAQKYGVTVDDVTRIADEYGLAVDQVNGKVIDPKVHAEQAKASLDELRTGLQKLVAADPTVTAIMDIKDPNAKMAALERLAMKYINSNPSTKAEFDSLSASNQILYLNGIIANIPGVASPVQMHFDALANINPATEKLGDLKNRLMEYSSSDPTAVAYLSTHNPTENAKYLKGLAMQWASESPEAAALLNKLGPQLDFQTLFAWATQWGNTSKTAIMKAVAETAEAEAKLAALARSRQVDIRVAIQGGSPGQINAAIQSHAGRWGMVTKYRQGGITPAHVQLGERIKYAEPETGGEAFIPRRGHRGRSKMVLAQAASWYGMKVTPMKKGGVTVTPGSGWHFYNGTWYDATGHAAGYATSATATAYVSRKEEAKHMHGHEAAMFSAWVTHAGAAHGAKKLTDDQEAAHQKWYDALPQLNKDRYNAHLAMANAHAGRSAYHPASAFPWSRQYNPHVPVEPTRSGGTGAIHYSMKVTAVTHINAPVYGVKDLEAAIEKGVTNAVDKNYGKVVETMRKKEDASK